MKKRGVQTWAGDVLGTWAIEPESHLLKNKFSTLAHFTSTIDYLSLCALYPERLFIPPKPHPHSAEVSPPTSSCSSFWYAWFSSSSSFVFPEVIHCLPTRKPSDIQQDLEKHHTSRAGLFSTQNHIYSNSNCVLVCKTISVLHMRSKEDLPVSGFLCTRGPYTARRLHLFHYL